MVVFRLVREQFASPLSGKGAALRGARWNSVGVELIYTAGNRSLAMAEVAVHLTLASLPSDYLMMSIWIPDDVQITSLSVSDLPNNWNTFPHPLLTQQIGDAFVANAKCAVLKIPSVVTYGDFNYLINPKHPDFSRIKVDSLVKFPFDRRLFGA
ncbi:RES family NAD+ phosphorylase [Parapedobacter sp. 10938]|uniref:RES family NAD+ phosphorylase n=1 Tax=Parapedobacter flavus TaxID=3110225 RepID=UPI002DB714D0|nr:RES family NAD+ phosphorylase [Parapedobacter sp. 10938]MEC3881369.1 RES family NAD+ phosphorylase [Parapedobacter sp. 10938]